MGFNYKNGWIRLSDANHEVVIVGAGMAGLVAAAYLSKAGHDVLLLEKNDYCGGLLTSFKRDGFVFDVGARSIENSGAVEPLLNELNISLTLLKSPVSVGIEENVINFTLSESLEDYKSILEKLYPQNVDEIKSIFSLINEIMKDMVILNEIDNPIITGIKNMNYVIKKLVPYVIRRFLGAVRRINRRNAPVEQTLKKYTTNQSLIDIIAQHFFKDTPTAFALGYFHTYLDYYYPEGGTAELPESLREKTVELGTIIQNGTEIYKVKPSENLLVDSNGNSYHYENLIWCADLKSLYRGLDLQGLKKNKTRRIIMKKEEVLKHRGGDSVYTLFLGVDEPLHKFQSISNGHFFYTPLRKGLGRKTWSKLHEINTNFETTSKKEIIKWLDAYCLLNTYEISIPGLRDSSLTPKGKTGLIASLLFDYDLVNKIQKAGWYEEFKTEMENRIIETLNNSIYPNIKDKILFSISSTPISISKRVGSSEGAITGWSFEESVPVPQNLFQIFSSVKTPIPNVLKAGQWAYSPSGIPIAILTGALAAKKLIKRKK